MSREPLSHGICLRPLTHSDWRPSIVGMVVREGLSPKHQQRTNADVDIVRSWAPAPSSELRNFCVVGLGLVTLELHNQPVIRMGSAGAQDFEALSTDSGQEVHFLESEEDWENWEAKLDENEALRLPTPTPNLLSDLDIQELHPEWGTCVGLTGDFACHMLEADAAEPPQKKARRDADRSCDLPKRWIDSAAPSSALVTSPAPSSSHSPEGSVVSTSPLEEDHPAKRRRAATAPTHDEVEVAIALPGAAGESSSPHLLHTLERRRRSRGAESHARALSRLLVDFFAGTTSTQQQTDDKPLAVGTRSCTATWRRFQGEELTKSFSHRASQLSTSGKRRRLSLFRGESCPDCMLVPPCIF
mmetsp:Transcript_79259/g.164517  ORF Transcript_79259/g.164517 Transcript_79259/m.164517 type:complete len:358 (+) Transcript_79259:67-1140(+)|eukprot:CAMPEP_0206453038 /NCGR_PEP_ID=MMETSP0324_2-20121206/20297_1 /ASSEMBLY_ACC=CAM_ASM_000836 /TAXON_ID=2866 /ORGANISM="Crypthecodinium cohnii, Strain Seligo" /LENGTH=357 /DNA_ID=CAMNT_0053923231 /DNA_START=31 /DNA_END=1104 /DNA_ORIENTATION=+